MAVILFFYSFVYFCFRNNLDKKAPPSIRFNWFPPFDVWLFQFNSFTFLWIISRFVLLDRFRRARSRKIYFALVFSHVGIVSLFWKGGGLFHFLRLSSCTDVLSLSYFRRVWTPEMEWSVWCRGQSPWWFHHILSSSLVHFHRLIRPLEKKKQFDYSANKIRNKMRKTSDKKNSNSTKKSVRFVPFFVDPPSTLIVFDKEISRFIHFLKITYETRI